MPGAGEFAKFLEVDSVRWVGNLVGTEMEERSDARNKTALAKATEMSIRQKSLDRVLRRMFAIMLLRGVLSFVSL